MSRTTRSLAQNDVVYLDDDGGRLGCSTWSVRGRTSPRRIPGRRNAGRQWCSWLGESAGVSRTPSHLQVAGASLGADGRTDVRADRPDGASSWEVGSAIGEHRQVAAIGEHRQVEREVTLTSEPAAYRWVPHGAESGAPVVSRTRSRGRGGAAAGRRARGQEG
jgi:hypothetical protein